MNVDRERKPRSRSPGESHRRPGGKGASRCLGTHLLKMPDQSSAARTAPLHVALLTCTGVWSLGGLEQATSPVKRESWTLSDRDHMSLRHF